MKALTTLATTVETRTATMMKESGATQRIRSHVGKDVTCLLAVCHSLDCVIQNLYDQIVHEFCLLFCRPQFDGWPHTMDVYHYVRPGSRCAKFGENQYPFICFSIHLSIPFLSGLQVTFLGDFTA